MAALELLGDIKGERAEDKTELGDKDAYLLLMLKEYGIMSHYSLSPSVL